MDKWLRLLVDRSIRLALTFCIAVALYAGLLRLIDFLWLAYIETAVGRSFLELYTPDLSAVEVLRAESFLTLSLRVTLVVIQVCLVLGALGQVSCLVSYLYAGRGFIQRLIIWGIPAVAFASIPISETYALGWEASVLLAALPTLVLFNSCIKFASELLPEIPDVFEGVVSIARKGLERDRRKEPRYEVTLPLAYSAPGMSGVQECMAYQISGRGFCIQGPADLARGDTIKFKMRVEDDFIHGAAKVRWTGNPGGVDAMTARLHQSGCLIVSMAKKHQVMLRSFLRGI